ncbi:MAG: 2-C-methyl-D-erythritol 4-phosphate cytidylyltransferase [Candidatus Neomarinimicrobiota bacterium]|nr:2-C-methyl-D-erythritol 4-phosphate cytidylyltransferase [Candidatus Neomarinimicrobiota bacterium]
MITSAIIPAAGSGLRFGEKKQLKEINGMPLIHYTLLPFISSKMIDEIIIAVSKDDINIINSVVKTINSTKPMTIVEGSSTRQGSIKNALKAINDQSKCICIHDAVRPFIQKELIEKTISSLKDCDAVIVGKKSTDTLKEVSNNVITNTIDREKIWQVQTPQVFLKNALLSAYSYADKENIIGTDDAILLEKAGFEVKIINDRSINFKITTKEDWIVAEALFNHMK